MKHLRYKIVFEYKNGSKYHAVSDTDVSVKCTAVVYSQELREPENHTTQWRIPVSELHRVVVHDKFRDTTLVHRLSRKARTTLR